MSKTSAFKNEVDLKFRLYNSIFLTLPIDGVQGTGILLPILRDECEAGLKAGKTPVEILDSFFEKHTSLKTTKSKMDFMFRILQYVERQVVLVDSLEDAAFPKVNNLEGTGSLRELTDRLLRENKLDELKKVLRHFGVRIVLTAHPTQFYPGTVLAIINDLTLAIENNNVQLIQTLLQQLGKTPFFKKEKPTPLDEATNLIWYLENIFYLSLGELTDKVIKKAEIENSKSESGQLVSLGFWPGGDRDGNPSVTVETTKIVADRLRNALLRNYHKDLRLLRRRLSFEGVYEKIVLLESKIINSIEQPNRKKRIRLSEMRNLLEEIEQLLIQEHNGFFLDLLKSFSNKVKLFGLHFASLDIRQDSRVIHSTLVDFLELNHKLKTGSHEFKYDELFYLNRKAEFFKVTNPIHQDTLDTFFAIKEIQNQNEEAACNRFIISNCRQPEDVARVFAMARMTVWENEIPIDIVPLFETIGDLETAGETMKILYEHPVYREHLKNRRNRQTIMLGFSDGTKDGGYFSANWSIYKAKEDLTRLSKVKGIEVLFFDGRGGPPARGGGDTHNFYASLGSDIANHEIQITIQGQTISSRFGTTISAEYYLELLLTAGLENLLFNDSSKQLSHSDRNILEELSSISYREYNRFKNDYRFLPFLEKISALKYYGMAKIGSRPSSRKHSATLNFEDLRAIPFVGAWSQMKQNVPGFFGVGTSLKEMENHNKLEECKKLYKSSLFFKTLVDNSMQSICKSNMELTNYLKNDPEYGDFWKWIKNEFELSVEMLLKVSGQNELLESNLSSKKSIELRESIVLPLVVIQQFALMKLREIENGDQAGNKYYKTYQKLVVRSLYGNINASRNSA